MLTDASSRKANRATFLESDRIRTLSRLVSVTHVNGRTTVGGASYAVDLAGNPLSRTTLPSGRATNFGTTPSTNY